MYNGNDQRNSNGTAYSGPTIDPAAPYSNPYRNNSGPRIAGRTIKPAYLYIGGLVLFVLALYFVLRFLNTSLVMHVSAYAAVLLIVANLRELIGQAYVNRSSTALLNLLVGAGLLVAYLTQFLGALLWIPAIILLVIATPLTFGRASVYQAYVGVARNTASAIGGRFFRRP